MSGNNVEIDSFFEEKKVGRMYSMAKDIFV